MKARREHPRPKTPGLNILPKMLKKNMRIEQKISEKMSNLWIEVPPGTCKDCSNDLFGFGRFLTNVYSNFLLKCFLYPYNAEKYFPLPNTRRAFGRMKNPRSMTSRLSRGDDPEALSMEANSFCFGFINIPAWNVGVTTRDSIRQIQNQSLVPWL